MDLLDVLIVCGVSIVVVGFPSFLVLMAWSTSARSAASLIRAPAYEREGHAARVRAARAARGA